MELPKVDLEEEGLCAGGLLHPWIPREPSGLRADPVAFSMEREPFPHFSPPPSHLVSVWWCCKRALMEISFQLQFSPSQRMSWAMLEPSPVTSKIKGSFTLTSAGVQSAFHPDGEI